MSSFHDRLFPVHISIGSRGGPRTSTLVQKAVGGTETRNALWSGPQWEFDVGFGITSLEDLFELQKFFIARNGAENTFRFYWPADFTSNPTNPTHTAAPGTRDQPMRSTVDGNPVGSGTNASFQLVKVYIEGSQQVVRPITLPEQGSISVWLGGVLKAEGSDYTINYSTGVVLFASNVTLGVVPEWSGKSHFRVRFGEGAAECIQQSIDGWDKTGVQSIPLFEVIDNEPAYISEYFNGGSAERTITSDFLVTSSNGYLQVFKTTVASKAAKLPDPAPFQDGTNHFKIVNDSTSTQSLLVKDEAGNTIGTLAAGKGGEANILLTTGGVKKWYLFCQ